MIESTYDNGVHQNCSVAVVGILANDIGECLTNDIRKVLGGRCIHSELDAWCAVDIATAKSAFSSRCPAPAKASTHTMAGQSGVRGNALMAAADFAKPL